MVVRQLCGPGINFVIGKPESNYVVRALGSRDVTGMVMPVRIESRVERPKLVQRKTRSGRGVCME
jgi:hypothetical protein